MSAAADGWGDGVGDRPVGWQSPLAAVAFAALTLLCSGAAWALPVCEWTPQVRDAILSAVQAEAPRLGSPYPYACEDVTRLSLVKSLPIPSAAITSLKAGDFDGLVSLESLELGGNSLTALPAGIFDRLASLQSLDLGDSDLTELPACIFDGLALCGSFA